MQEQLLQQVEVTKVTEGHQVARGAVEAHRARNNIDRI
jgi:hypothetical protein